MHDGCSSLLAHDAAYGKKKGMWSAYYPRSSHARLPLSGTGRSFALHASDMHRRANDDNDDDDDDDDRDVADREYYHKRSAHCPIPTN